MSSAKDSYGDPTPGSTAYIGLAGVLIFILTVIYLETLYYSTDEQQRIEKNENLEYQVLGQVRASQTTNLNSYSYDHAYGDNIGRVTIPISDAIDHLLAEWPDPNMGIAGIEAGQRVVTNSSDATSSGESSE